MHGIHLSLTGSSRVGYGLLLCTSFARRRLTCIDRTRWPEFSNSMSGPRMRLVKHDDEFFKHDWVLVEPDKGTSKTLAAGNLEFPFEVILQGDTPESVEGLVDSYIVYRLKATIERGRHSHNFHARKHLRVVRTMEVGDLATVHEMVGPILERLEN